MALDFPSSPTNGQTYGNYYYDSTVGAWNSFSSTVNTVPSTLKNLTVTTDDVGVTPFTVKSLAGTTVVSINDSGTISANTLSLTNVLTVANGGTGAGTFTTGSYLKGNGTSAIQAQTGIPFSDVTMIEIPAAADLNTYTTQGLYHQSQNTEAAGGTNYPVALAGLLQVYQSGVDGNGFTYQTYSVYQGAPAIWSRTKYNTTWSAWQQIPVGTVTVGEGGTGTTTFTAGTYLKGNGTSAIQAQVGIPASDITAYMSPNYLMNGGYDIWQRGTSGTVGYVADRWIIGGNGTVATTRSADTPSAIGVTYSISVAQTSGTYPLIYQRIESIDAAKFAGQTVVLSFWAKSTSGTQGIAFQANLPAGVDNWTSTTTDYQAIFAASMTVGSWTRYTATWSASASAKNGYQIYIYRDVPSSSTTTTLFTGLQLELGSIATGFRRNGNSVAEELLACQRFFQYHDFIAGTSDGYWKITTNPIGQVLRTTPSSIVVGTVQAPNTGTVLGTNVSMTIHGKGSFYTSVGSLGAGGWVDFISVFVNADL